MMDIVEQQLKNLVLKDVEFSLDGKCVKKGKIKLFNTKQFFIRFKIETNGELKDWELPYPFKMETLENGFVFNYALSAFCPPTDILFYKMKMSDKSNASKFYDAHLKVVEI